MRLRIVLAAVLAASFAVSAAGAGAAFRFGSKLDSTVQPSNAETAHPCRPAHPEKRCTWVMNEAYGRPNGGHKAPRRGTITKIRLIAGESGSFKLQIAKAHKNAAGKWVGKVVRGGPTIHYGGQPDPDEPYRVEVFTVSVPIKAGERLAIRARKTSTLRCSSGGDNTLLFTPPLVVGKAFRRATDGEGCWLLLEAVVRPG
jgi:hypothetical protein